MPGIHGGQVAGGRGRGGRRGGKGRQGGQGRQGQAPGGGGGEREGEEVAVDGCQLPAQLLPVGVEEEQGEQEEERQEGPGQPGQGGHCQPRAFALLIEVWRIPEKTAEILIDGFLCTTRLALLAKREWYLSVLDTGRLHM